MLKCEIEGVLVKEPLIYERSGIRTIKMLIAHIEPGQLDKQTWIDCLYQGDNSIISQLKQGTELYASGKIEARIYTKRGTGASVASLVLKADTIRIIEHAKNKPINSLKNDY